MGEGEPPSRQHEPDQIADGAERTGPDILVPGVVGAVDRRLAERQEGVDRNVKRRPRPRYADNRNHHDDPRQQP
jgi:hypothetical protein